jgi:pimeloyl-ACP methyl ester carboxylesterase
MVKEGSAHHRHSLQNPKLIADWIVGHMQLATAARPAFADQTFTKTYYYSLEDSYIPLKEEKTFAVCRGPGFVECYDRYDVRTKSQWGILGMAVIVPNKESPGKPWVFRAEPSRRDAAIDQALLAKGYHIVTPPLTAQSGPVREQWDAIYQLLTSHGFSKKPVLEGTGSAVGEAYAWAIENPDKVSCIYGENPVLRSLMSKKMPLDNLGPLAKASVPVLHLCGSLDPWLDGQTRVAEKRYKELGCQMTVIVREGEGHFIQAGKDKAAVLDFIVANQRK